MNVCVIGFGHFASIVAAGLAERHHTVAQSDEMPHLVRLGQVSPESEPEYTESLETMRARGCIVPALDSVDIYWIAYDVPLDSHGAPDTTEVERRIVALDSRVSKDIPFIVSCQWPVGTTRKVSERCQGRELIYVMENVRAGKAVIDFSSNPFPVIGVNMPLSQVAATFLASRFQMMPISWESAEMAKHATNGFMALQIAFANEIATVCRLTGADADDVMRAVQSDQRVSGKAPLRPGAPFGGGSLQRDLMVLEGLTDGPIIHAIRKSNDSRS